MTQKKLRKGDVVVIKWHCMEGELGIVTGLLNGGYEVTTKGNFSRFTSDVLEVIDHIDEEEPTFKIKASLQPEDMERALDEIMSGKADDALSGDICIYRGDPRPRWNGSELEQGDLVEVVNINPHQSHPRKPPYKGSAYVRYSNGYSDCRVTTALVKDLKVVDHISQKCLDFKFECLIKTNRELGWKYIGMSTPAYEEYMNIIRNRDKRNTLDERVVQKLLKRIFKEIQALKKEEPVMTQKKLRKGDVVVITSSIGLENRYGWLGLIDHVVSYNDPHLNRYGVIVSNEIMGYIAEYGEESLEVIDHIDETDDLDNQWPDDEEQRPGYQADEPTKPQFKVGDRVIYTGELTQEFKGKTGIIIVTDAKDLAIVEWDNYGNDTLKESPIRLDNIQHYKETKIPKKEYTFHEVKMSFDGHTPLVCFDCSGSMDLDNLREQWNEYKQTVTADTNFGYVFGVNDPHPQFLDKLSLAYEWSQGAGQGTDLQSVLDVSKAYRALLIFSDGQMDLSCLKDYPQLRTVIITPKNEVMFYRGATLAGQGTITPPKDHYDAPPKTITEVSYPWAGVIKHVIEGTNNVLEISDDGHTAKVICRSCNTVLKEIDLTK